MISNAVHTEESFHTTFGIFLSIFVTFALARTFLSDTFLDVLKGAFASLFSGTEIARQVRTTVAKGVEVSELTRATRAVMGAILAKKSDCEVYGQVEHTGTRSVVRRDVNAIVFGFR